MIRRAASPTAPMTPSRSVLVLLLASATALVGCTGATPPVVKPPIVPPVPGTEGDVIAKFVEVDRSNDWTPANCSSLGDRFAQYAVSDPYLPAMHYNLGIVRERCMDRPAAKGVYEEILAKDATFYPARVRLALITFATDKTPNIDAAITELEQAVKDSKFQSVDALTELARLQMERDQKGDHDGALANLKRALAVDDAFMSAFNLLAILYLNDAEKLPPSEQKPAFELALLVASQAMRKNDKYAPIYNTSGLVYAAMGDSTNAADMFDKARTLDPNFFEAHMNFGQLNLGFRGFTKAEPALRKAIGLHPDDYDAHLGLALAISGQITQDNLGANFHDAKAELERAIFLDPKRPEAYFNEAELEMTFGSKLEGAEGEGALLRAKSRYESFVEMARGKPAYAAKVDDVTARATKPDPECFGDAGRADHACKKGRLQSIDEILEFNASVKKG